CVELYQWLSRHFNQKNFEFDEQALLENKSKAIERLNELLSDKIGKTCSSCGCKMPANSRFNICEECFAARRFGRGPRRERPGEDRPRRDGDRRDRRPRHRRSDERSPMQAEERKHSPSRHGGGDQRGPKKGSAKPHRGKRPGGQSGNKKDTASAFRKFR